MKFRVCSGSSSDRPCDGLREEVYARVGSIYKASYSKRTIDEWRQDKKGPWLGRGKNHRETEDRLFYEEDEKGWFIELADLAALLEFYKTAGYPIIVEPDGDIPGGWLLALYDGYLQ